MEVIDLYKLRIDRIIDTQIPLFFRNPNIVAIGRGRKIVNGKMLNEPTLTFFVRKKVSSNLLHPSMIIPNFVMGSYTDVIEDSEERELTLDNNEPARASGAIIRVDENNINHIGTLSYFVTEDKISPIGGNKRNIFLLGSAHLLDPKNENKSGTKIYYNKTRKELEKKIALGKFYKSVPRIVGEIKDTSKYNLVDAATAFIGPDDAETRKKIGVELIDGTKILGTKYVEPGEKVFKVGATTALTYGQVLTTNTAQKRPSKSLKVDIYYAGLIKVKIVTAPGDSGALGISEKGELAFGIVNTGNGETATFSNINNVLRILNIKFLE